MTGLESRGGRVKGLGNAVEELPEQSPGPRPPPTWLDLCSRLLTGHLRLPAMETTSWAPSSALLPPASFSGLPV